MIFFSSFFNGFLVFALLFLWSQLDTGVEAGPTVTTTVAPTPPPMSVNDATRQQAQYSKYFDFASRGFDIATASLDDLEQPVNTWKKNIWTSNSNNSYFDKTLNWNFNFPSFLSVVLPTDAYSPLGAIYRTAENLTELLDAVGAPLSHRNDYFENRFQATTLPKERTLNGLVALQVTQLEVIINEDKQFFNQTFQDAVKNLVSKPETFANAPKKYLDFVNDYGTHYIKDFNLGGIFMLDAQIPIESGALKKNPMGLENDIFSHAKAVLFQNGTDPVDATSKKIHYTPIYFGGNATSQTEKRFYKELKWNRVISRVFMVKPISSIILSVQGLDATAAANLQIQLKEVEESQMFRYELNRLKAACEVAMKSPFQETAIGYQNCKNALPFLDHYLVASKKMPYPKKDETYKKYISKILMWPLEYQIALRGTLGYNYKS